MLLASPARGRAWIETIIRHEVYQATGSFPLADSIPFVQQPSASGEAAPAQSTGEGPGPTLDTSSSGGSASSSGSLLDSLTSGVESLTQKGMWVIGLIAIGLVLGVALITQSRGGFRR